MRFLRRHWPLPAALLLAAAIAAVELEMSLRMTAGHLIYALDDPYIHMAMAKNIATHGVWGVTPFGFTNASSSPLWLIMVTTWYMIAGVNEHTPLALNLFFAALLLVVSYAVLRRFMLRSITVFLLLASVILLMPMVPVAMTGLEHLLHATVSLLFLYLAAEILAAPPPERRVSLPELALLCLAPLVTAARYEGLFLVGSAALLLLARRRWLYAAGLVAASLLPIVAYGLFSTSHGWEFLPNSLLLKGNMPHLTLVGVAKLLGLTAVKGFTAASHLLVLTLAGLMILYLRYARTGHVRDVSSTMILLAFFTTLLHLQFARLGWFYRYEGYLVAIWIVTIGASFPELGRALMPVLGRGRLSFAIAATIPVVALTPLLMRAGASHAEAPQASRNIYEQQYQMGLFLRTYYEGRGVAANDVGAINFLADIENLDLWGLASIDVARAKMRGEFNTAAIEQLVRRHRSGIAIVYDDWFTEYGGLPANWVRVGQWGISDNVVAGGSVVSFYATDSLGASRLAGSLRDFSARLPERVMQRGAYMESK